MVKVLASSAVNCELKLSSGQTKEDYKIGICCFSATHAALRCNKDWLARNQDNVSEWRNMSTGKLLLRWPSTIKIQLRVTKTGWLGIKIMCRSGETCLPANCCFNDLHYKNPTKQVGLVQSRHYHHLIKMLPVLAII